VTCARGVGLVLAALFAASWAAAPTSAWACGAMVSSNGQAEMSGFVSLVSADGAGEDIVTAIAYGGQTADFGWLMPLPAAPQITRANTSGLAAAARITEPPYYRRQNFVPLPMMGAAAPGAGGVVDLGRTVVAGIEFVTLQASGTDALSRWMAANGFAYHGQQAQALGSYLQRGWVVVAARLTREVASTGTSISVRLRFPSATLVYPLVVAGNNSHPDATVRTTFYVVTPWRPIADGLPTQVVKPDDQGTFAPPGDLLEMRYSAPLSSSDAADIGASVAVSPGAWLTLYASNWRAQDLKLDLVLMRSPDQSRVDFTALLARQQAFQQVDGLISLGILGGLVLFLSGIPVTLLTLAIVFLTQRRRRTR
jgi:hypothetical protein